MTREISSARMGCHVGLMALNPARPTILYRARPMQPTSADAGLDSKHCHRQGEQSNGSSVFFPPGRCGAGAASPFALVTL